MKALQIDFNATALPGEITVCQEKNNYGQTLNMSVKPIGLSAF